jgi:histidinol-phosphate aminotransferase
MDKTAEMTRSVGRIREGKEFFVAAMRLLGFGVLPTDGNFVHVAFGESGGAVHAALSARVLYRAAFDHPCLRGYSRFTVAPHATMSEVVSLIAEAVGKGGS